MRRAVERRIVPPAGLVLPLAGWDASDGNRSLLDPPSKRRSLIIVR